METLTNKSVIQKIINDVAEYGFVPSNTLYDAVNINRKRWGTIVRGEKEPTLSEFKAICKFFKVETSNYI